MKTVKKFWKILRRVLAVILALVLLAAAFVAVVAGKNVKSMDHLVDTVMEALGNDFTVTPVDAGEYEEMTMYGILKFQVDQYEIERIGNLSIMRVNAGLMQMATVVITPRDKNLPLLSADYMYILNSRKAYLEFYDVVADKDNDYRELLSALEQALENSDHLDDIEATPAWYAPLLTVTSYKGGGMADDGDLETMLTDCLQVYLQYAKTFPELAEEERAEKIQITMDYTDGLIERGGISTDMFKSAFGNDKTKDFFDRVFFGTAAE